VVARVFPQRHTIYVEASYVNRATRKIADLSKHFVKTMESWLLFTGRLDICFVGHSK
jgi:hypothetical protein